MQSVLFDDDLFSLIVPHLTSDKLACFPPTTHLWDDRQRLSTLLSLALTCRAFANRALDELWWRLDDFSTLLKLLPTFKRFEDGAYFLDGPISDCHWEVFDAYAKRVRFLCYVGEAKIDPSVYFYILHQRGSKALLPTLQDLFYMDTSPELLILISPTIRRFRAQAMQNAMDDRGFYPELWSFLDRLSDSAKTIQHLYLSMMIPGHCLHSILKMKSLERLELCQAGRIISVDINAAFLSKLAAIEKLSHLAFYGLGPSPRFRPSAFGTAILRSLTSLIISSTLSELIPLLQVGRFPALSVLTICIDRPLLGGAGQETFVEDEWQEFFGLVRHHAGETLTDLHLSSRLNATPASRGIAYPDLLSLNLIRLSISFPLFASLNTEDLVKFGDSWPDMEYLNIMSAEATPGIPVKALSELAKRMLNLESLYITIKGAPPAAVEKVKYPSHPLDRLHVGKSALLETDIDSMAQFIRTTFPNLWDSVLDCSPGSRYGGQWEAVKKIIDDMKYVG